MVHREPGVGTFTSLWYIIFSIKFLMFEISTVQVQLFVCIWNTIDVQDTQVQQSLIKRSTILYCVTVC